jgi:predicted negative regulator of RcsB-dependent stress response
MLKAQKKLTKRQLKEDKFVTFYFRAQDWVSENMQKILFGVLGVVVLIAISAYFNKQAGEDEQAASLALSRARLELSGGNMDMAVGQLSELVSQYGTTPSGIEGRFWLANAYFQTADYANAEANYREFVEDSDDPVLKSSALAGVAACQEQQGNHLAAAKGYREAADRFSEVFTASDNLFHAARCYILAGQSDEAISLLTRLLRDYSTSSVKEDAEVLLAEIS